MCIDSQIKWRNIATKVDENYQHFFNFQYVLSATFECFKNISAHQNQYSSERGIYMHFTGCKCSYIMDMSCIKKTFPFEHIHSNTEHIRYRATSSKHQFKQRPIFFLYTLYLDAMTTITTHAVSSFHTWKYNFGYNLLIDRWWLA